MTEIERKWIISPKRIPSLEGLTAVSYERHFIFVSNGIEVRIQKKGEKFEFERKVAQSELQRVGEKFDITKEEYTELKKLSKKSISRESYIIQDTVEVSLKFYKENFEGLIRAEIEFNSEEEALEFIPFEWFGKEITNTPLGRDAKLVELGKEEFQTLLDEYLY